MKNIMTLGAALVLTLAAFASNNEGTTRYKVDNSASTITWHATKMTGEHMGTVNLANGYMSVTDGNMTAASVVVDMQSIACTDLEGEWADKLVGHLASEDFFHVSEHKSATFSLENIKPLEDATGESTHFVSGTFTIRGITKSVSFPANVQEKDGNLSIQGSVTLNRAQFDVKYGSGSFFDNLGDNLIHDDFTVTFDLVAAGV